MDFLGRNARQVDCVAIIFSKSKRSGGNSCGSSSNGDERLCFLDFHRLGSIGDGIINIFYGLGDRARTRWGGLEMALRHANTPNIDALCSNNGIGSDHKLSRSTTDIHYKVWRIGVLQYFCGSHK